LKLQSATHASLQKTYFSFIHQLQAMTKDYPGEQWKTIKFNFDYTNDLRMEISNFGRLRSFNKISNGNILKGSMVNGYRIIRLKFYKEREEKTQREFDNLKLQMSKLSKHLKQLKLQKEPKAVIAETADKLEEVKKTYSRKIKLNEKKRTIHYQSLIHRLVATYFLRKPSEDHIIVAHLDHNKLNNRSYNLKWMTIQENADHQKGSPLVIAEKKERANHLKPNSTAKLSVTKVMLLKKLLNQDKPVRQLAKQFKVTETQIIRIRKGENWANVKAAT
jgi:hypothetical protein